MPKAPIVRCRYAHKYGGCGEPAVDPGGLMLLCEVHMRMAREFLAERDLAKARR